MGITIRGKDCVFEERMGGNRSFELQTMEKENEEMRLDLGMEVRERIGTVVVAIDHFIISIFRVFIFILFYIKFFFFS